MSVSCPLKQIALKINSENQVSKKRRRWKAIIGRYWGVTLAIAGGSSFLLVLAWPVFVSVTIGPMEQAISLFDWILRSFIIDGFAPIKLYKLPESYPVVPFTIPVIAIGTLIAFRQSVLSRIKQIADDKQAVRWKTLEHLQQTVDKFREREMKFMADIIRVYKHQKMPIHTTPFRDAIHDRVMKRHPNVAKESVEYERCLKVVLSELSKNSRIVAEHGRPRLNAEIVSLIREYYPLFSFSWGHLMAHEQLGLGLARKCYGIKTIDGMSGPQVVDTFLTWQLFILSVRKIPGYRTAFSQFQWMVSIVVMLRAARSSARYYGIKIVSLDHKPDDHNRYWLRLSTQSYFIPSQNIAYYRPRLTNAVSAIMETLTSYGSRDNIQKKIREEVRAILDDSEAFSAPEKLPSYVEIDNENRVLSGTHHLPSTVFGEGSVGGHEPSV